MRLWLLNANICLVGVLVITTHMLQTSRGQRFMASYSQCFTLTQTIRLHKPQTLESVMTTSEWRQLLTAAWKQVNFPCRHCDWQTTCRLYDSCRSEKFIKMSCRVWRLQFASFTFYVHENPLGRLFFIPLHQTLKPFTCAQKVRSLSDFWNYQITQNDHVNNIMRYVLLDNSRYLITRDWISSCL